MSSNIQSIPSPVSTALPPRSVLSKAVPVLVVNVASKCGLTPQYTALEKLYETYAPRGLEIAVFRRMISAPRSRARTRTSRVSVPPPTTSHSRCLRKFPVKGPDQHPLYTALTEAQPHALTPDGSDFKAKLEGYGITFDDPADVMWKFREFLIDKHGARHRAFQPRHHARRSAPRRRDRKGPRLK